MKSRQTSRHTCVLPQRRILIMINVYCKARLISRFRTADSRKASTPRRKNRAGNPAQKGMWSRQDRYGTDERSGSNSSAKGKSSKNSLEVKVPTERAAIAKAAKKRWWT